MPSSVAPEQFSGLEATVARSQDPRLTEASGPVAGKCPASLTCRKECVVLWRVYLHRYASCVICEARVVNPQVEVAAVPAPIYVVASTAAANWGLTWRDTGDSCDVSAAALRSCACDDK